MKKIGIDARLITQTGVGRYVSNLLFYLARYNPYAYHIYVYDEEGYAQVSSISSKYLIKKAPFRWHSLSEQYQFLYLLNKDTLDLMHFTYLSYPLFYTRPFIHTIHDLTPYFFKTGKATTHSPFIYSLKYFFYRLLLKKSLRFSRCIITPSHTVKSQLLDIFGTAFEEKINVTYEGVPYEFVQAYENNTLSDQFPFPFFIYVGNFYPHKNVERLLSAFQSVDSTHHLILVGKKDFFSHRITQRIKELNLSRKVHMYTNGTDSDLKFFYQHAKALLIPSLSEGFCLPLLEATHEHLPVIASSIPIIKEIMRDSFVAFDPYDVLNIAHTINQFIHTPQEFPFKTILSRFSFEKMTQTTFALYQKYV